MDKRYIKNYWKEVRRRAWASAWDKSGMKALISVFVVLLGAVALAGIPLMFGWIEYPFFRDSLFANSLTGLAQLIVSVSILVYLFFLLLSQTPPKMHKEKEDVIENQKQTIAGFERQLSNKKIRIDDEREYIQKNGVDTELRFAIYNDSVFPMENWMALVEEVSYTKNGNQKPVETNFPKNTFHLSWVGEPAMGDRIKPIPPHDYTLGFKS